MQRQLAIDRSPPLSLSLRFFVSAPLFAALALAILMWQGPPALDSRWTPALLAATHLLTLGVLTMTMIGALLQILPVVAGASIAWPRASAAVIHALLCYGTLLLAAAFLWSWPFLFKLALPALIVALGWLLAACAVGLWRAKKSAAHATLVGVGLSLLALLATLILGATLAGAFGFGWQGELAIPMLTDLHVLWALAGWIGLLVIGVAFQVIPMFQVTAIYPPIVTRALTPTLAAHMLACSVAQIAGHSSVGLLRTALVLEFCGFALLTLFLLARRKRPAPDATTLFWRASMASLIVCALLWFAPIGADTRAQMLGIVFLLGFAWSATIGMLYKIVPFLLWHHWQLLGLDRPVPGIRLIIPDQVAKGQFYAHLLGIVLLAVAPLWPQTLTRVAALAAMFSTIYLAANLLRALRAQPAC